MSSHIQGQGRSQFALFPEVLDNFVSKDNPIRVIDAFVDHLDLQSLGFQRVEAKSTGRPVQTVISQINATTPYISLD